MKRKETRKEVKNGVDKIITLGYCEEQEIVRKLEDNHTTTYCAGVYGWDCDNIYIFIDGEMVVISTGYRPIKSNISKEEQKELFNRIKEELKGGNL